ncbi:Aldo/keto reductase [Clavulina sp. PMI_390]|nr:Aldo/keto reductase [Clavulina sp. PMI_390]
MAANPNAPTIVMGTMTFGEPGLEGARVNNLEDAKAILDVFQKHGYTELDTAGVYTSGTSEKFLGTLDWKARGLSVSTKVHPGQNIKHTPEDIRREIEKSLASLKTDQVDIYYLHAPERTTPYEVTLKAVDELYKEGKFKRLGISNYPSWEVGEIVTLCRINGWVQPTVYQGLYNAIHRAAEPELFPALRKYGISFYEYNPLGGGFFTGKYKKDQVPEAGTRFDPTLGTGQSMRYRERYWTDSYFQALDQIEVVAKKHNLTLAEVALRWMTNHSLLKKEHGDAIIIGASSVNHIEQNLLDLEKGPLPPDVLAALDEAWKNTASPEIKYFR